MDPHEAARAAWDRLDDADRRALFLALHVYVGVLDPIELLLREMEVAR